MAQESNPYDDLQPVGDSEEAQKIIRSVKAEQDRIDYLIHYLFFQLEEGQELLKYLNKMALMRPSATPGMDILTVGMNEGTKLWIREINLIIERVNKNE